MWKAKCEWIVVLNARNRTHLSPSNSNILFLITCKRKNIWTVYFVMHPLLRNKYYYSRDKALMEVLTRCRLEGLKNENYHLPIPDIFSTGNTLHLSQDTVQWTILVAFSLFYHSWGLVGLNTLKILIAFLFVYVSYISHF